MAQTATNPQTGETVVLIGDKWTPAEKSATGADGKKAFLAGGEWHISDKSAAPINTADGIRFDPRGVSKPPSLPDIPQQIVDFAGGASSLMRGGANLISDGMGDKIWPKKDVQDSGYKIAGQILDPVSLAIGGGVAKIAPYVPVLGKGIVGGAEAMIKNFGAGSLAGGAIGGLSDEGDSGSGGLIGGAANVVLPPAVVAAGKTAGVIRDLVGPTAGRAGRLLNDVTREKAAAVIEALQNASTRVPGVKLTAGQASVPSGSAEMAALQEIINNRAPTKYLTGGIEGQNEAARQAAMLGKSGVPDDVARAVALRAAETAPMRETALANANLAGELKPVLEGKAAALGDAAAGKVEDVRRLSEAQRLAEKTAADGRMTLAPIAAEGVVKPPVKYSYGEELAQRADKAAQSAADSSLALGEAGRFNQRLADSLAEHGNYPLTAKSITSSLDPIIADGSQPTLARKAMGAIKADLENFTDKNGVVNASVAYRIRKEIGNTVQQFADADKSWDKRLTAGVIKDAQSAIDSAIEKAGGSGWKDYLKKYTEMSGPIENMKSAQKVQQALTEPLGVAERPAAFARATQNADNPITNAQTQNVIDAIMENLGNEAKYSKLAREGVQSATNRIGAELPQIPSAGMFSPKISMTRAAMNQLSGKATNSTLRYLEKIMDDPKAVAELMLKHSPEQRGAIIDALMKQKANPYIGASAASAYEGNR